jgi:hypothetical protein
MAIMRWRRTAARSTLHRGPPRCRTTPSNEHGCRERWRGTFHRETLVVTKRSSPQTPAGAVLLCRQLPGRGITTSTTVIRRQTSAGSPMGIALNAPTRCSWLRG